VASVQDAETETEGRRSIQVQAQTPRSVTFLYRSGSVSHKLGLVPQAHLCYNIRKQGKRQLLPAPP
jgi:hypothetical protein